MLRIGALLAAVALSASSTGPGDDAPEPDSCADLGSATATAIAVGRDGSGVFAAFAPGDVAMPIAGVQGSDMLPVRFLIDGLDAGCVAQRTEIRYCAPGAACEGGGEIVASSEVALRTYEQGASLVTADHFLIFSQTIETGGQLSVTATVAGVTDSVTLIVGEFR